jgi:hypothetical protein
VPLIVVIVTGQSGCNVIELYISCGHVGTLIRGVEKRGAMLADPTSTCLG